MGRRGVVGAKRTQATALERLKTIAHPPTHNVVLLRGSNAGALHSSYSGISIGCTKSMRCLW